MEVYIEYVILDNLVINTLIIILTLKTLKSLKINKVRVLLSSMVGTVFAIMLPYISLPYTIMILLKISLGIIMTTIFYTPTSFKDFMASTLLFFTYTFVLGGVCFGIIFLFNNNITISSYTLHNFNLPISLFLSIFIIYAYFLYKLVTFTKHLHTTSNLYYTLILKHNNKSYYLKGFLDTGNQLRHEAQPITLINIRSFCKIFKVPLENIVLNKVPLEQLKDPTYIKIQALTGSNNLLIFKVQELTVKLNKTEVSHKDIYLGLAKTNFNNKFDCLLNPIMF